MLTLQAYFGVGVKGVGNGEMRTFKGHPGFELTCTQPFISTCLPSLGLYAAR